MAFATQPSASHTFLFSTENCSALSYRRSISQLTSSTVFFMGAWQHSSCLRFDTQVMLLCVYMPVRCVHTAAGFFSVLRISGGSFMTEQKTSTESQSLPSSTPSPTEGGISVDSSVEACPVVYRFTGGCCVTGQMAHRCLVTNRYIAIHFCRGRYRSRSSHVSDHYLGGSNRSSWWFDVLE